MEESENEDDEDKNNITFDEEDIKEAYDDVMEIENNSKTKNKEVVQIKFTKVKSNENIDNNTNNMQCINNA